uniref:Uncharacterized protein n=1 Tax=Anguilla anguilla TaxID=7936 RepID=A0A0E9UA18_ANGAN
MKYFEKCKTRLLVLLAGSAAQDQ